MAQRPAPLISVVLGTSRPTYGAFRAWPDRDHLAYTMESLAGQMAEDGSAMDFELIIADCLYSTALRDTAALAAAAVRLGRPVYHVPVTSPWLLQDRPAICAARNTGIAHAAREYVVFVDDCAWCPPNFLARYWHWWTRPIKSFANALHIRMRGSEEVGRDGRFGLFAGRPWIYNDFEFNGYMSASMEALLRINGFDEAYDGSRQLEDGDLSQRLKRAGYKIVLDPGLTVQEQEHVGPLSPRGRPTAVLPRCNGPWIFRRMFERPGEFEANRRDWTDEERARTRPCGYLKGRTCTAINVECNMWEPDTGRHTHETLANEFMVAPVFDLTERRAEALAVRDQYRI